MKPIIASAVLGLGALGLLGALPTEAKAYWPPGMTYGYRVGPYAYSGTMIGNPFFRYNVGMAQYNMMYGYPGYYRTYTSPYGARMMYQSPSIMGTAFNPIYGSYNYYMTPGFAGWSYSPYTGYRQYAIPGVSYVTPAGYSSGYIPAGYGY